MATIFTDARHPVERIGPVTAVYVWQYPLRLIHWGLVLSLAALSFTGYYIQNPFIVGQLNRPFFMGWFRFVHESFAMLLIALLLLRVYLFFQGNRWVQWRSYVPRRKEHFIEMLNMAKFYLFMRPEPVSKIGHNRLAALSYISMYSLAFVEIVTGLTLFNVLRHGAVLDFFVGWIPSVISLPTLRLIHFFLMYVFAAFTILHIHLSMLVSRQEKKGLMDSIFIGYKVIPVKELEEEEVQAQKARK
jgi:Ni/Fe-hydrogenase 1 B-type cytochrome subunit